MRKPVTIQAHQAVTLVLRKHHLTTRSAGGDPLDVIDDLVGLHATGLGSPYLQLRARVPAFAPERLDTLLDGGRVARVPCMRSTLFLERADRLPMIFAATREGRVRGRQRYLAASGLTAARYERLAARIEAALAGRALGVRELQLELGTEEALSPAVIMMCDDARLVRWKGARGWRAGRPTYRRFKEAVATGPLTGVDARGALAGLVDWYIRRYGPVSEGDVVWWTGQPARAVREAIAANEGVFAIRVSGWEGPHLLHETDLATATSAARRVSDAVLLPVLDPLLQGYRDRGRWVDARHLPFVVDRGGNSTSVVLVDGRVAGVWDYIVGAAEVRLHFFTAPTPRARRSVQAAAAEVGEFLARHGAAIVEVPHMEPLVTRGLGAVLSPLA